MAAPASSSGPRPKITLGGKKSGPAGQVLADPTIPSGVPLDITSAQSASFDQDLQVIRVKTKRGKENAPNADVEEVPPLKRARGSDSPTQTPVIDVLLSGEHPATNLSRLNELIPVDDGAKGLSLDQIRERGAHDVVQLTHTLTALFRRAKATEDGEALRKAAERHEMDAKELRHRVKSTTDRMVKVEAQAKETQRLLGSPRELAARVCSDRAEAEDFFRHFLKNSVGEELAWTLAKWAFNAGQRRGQQEDRGALAASLDDDDLASVLGILPDEVPDPGPEPFATSSATEQPLPGESHSQAPPQE
ncbi:PREDICTED: uncharacterized protein LOC109184184 [Ipomoea nil]|uniref:uncharacterized protein LOC109184184 n=1 Tax=Ipomoea nil TaxID=35883 RepID=UPI000901CD7A|nr:PREDICTED: uncharacterized protein LOC109184184 [Ipomoea nil]